MGSHIEFDPEGRILTIKCKVCGGIVASTQLRPTSPVSGSALKHKFTRHNNYTEIKMELDDGSFHVTNGCGDCLKARMDPDILYELWSADMQEMGIEEGTARPVKVVKIDRSARGIL